MVQNSYHNNGKGSSPTERLKRILAANFIGDIQRVVVSTKGKVESNDGVDNGVAVADSAFERISERCVRIFDVGLSLIKANNVSKSVDQGEMGLLPTLRTTHP